MITKTTKSRSQISRYSDRAEARSSGILSRSIAYSITRFHEDRYCPNLLLYAVQLRTSSIFSGYSSELCNWQWEETRKRGEKAMIETGGQFRDYLLQIKWVDSSNYCIVVKTVNLNGLAFIAQAIYTDRRLPLNLVPTNLGRVVSRGQRKRSPRPLISVLYTGPLPSRLSSSSVALTRLSGQRFRRTGFQKIW
jgi:hypothetical protein